MSINQIIKFVFLHQFFTSVAKFLFLALAGSLQRRLVRMKECKRDPTSMYKTKEYSVRLNNVNRDKEAPFP